jgi:effector-binding domain-containing protein
MMLMGKKGIAPVGAPFAYWHNMNSESMSKGVFDMECGFPIGKPVEGEGQIRSSKLSGGKVITAMHVGPYETPMSPGRGSHVTDGKPHIVIRSR